MSKPAKHKRHGGNKYLLEYRSWISMIDRCTNPNHPYFDYYNKRNIIICEQWRNSFEAFLKDMGARPSIKHSIERIDNDGNYEPENCKWGTKTEQSRNQRLRKDNTSGVRGVCWHKNMSKWEAVIRVDKKRIYLGSFDTLEKAANARRLAEEKYWGKVYS